MASIDVVVPCYQYGRFLGPCVTSILNQDFRNVRVLIVDNASTDDSLDVARRLASADRRVEIIAHGTNLGHHASFNEGIDWASAEYFALVFADDLMAPGCLTRAASFMSRHPEIAFCHGRAIPIDGCQPLPDIEPGCEAPWRVIEGRRFIERFCRAGVFRIAGSTLVVRTSAQKKAGHYRPSLPYTDDMEIWLRLACQGHVAETDAVLGFLRSHGANRSALKNTVQNLDLLFTEAAVDSFFMNEGAALGNAKQLHRLAKRTLAQRAYWSAMSNLVRGNPRLSVDLLKFAFSRSPATALIPPVGYLFRREDAFRRIAQVALEAGWWPSRAEARS